MRETHVGVFEHIQTTSPMGVDKRVAYMQIIFKGATVLKYREVMV